jgi:hypothetical protein
MSKNEGRLVRQAHTTLNGNEFIIKPEIGQVVICENEFHGDHDEDWLVVRTVIERRELGRYNTRFVSCIVWVE